MFIEWLLNLPYLFLGPRKRLERTCAALEVLSDTNGASGESIERAWKHYNKALALAGRCGHVEVTRVVIDFDKNFSQVQPLTTPSPSNVIDILLSAPRPDIQTLEAAWLLSKRVLNESEVQAVQQKICLELAQRGDTDKLISKLQERREAATLPIKDFTEILNLFLKKNTLAENAAWKPFFLSFDTHQIPLLHQVYALLNGQLEAANLAAAVGEHSSEFQYLLAVHGTVPATRALALAEALGDKQSLMLAHQKLAEALWEDGHYKDAAMHFEKAGIPERASDCYLRLGQFDSAIRLRPTVSLEWQQHVRDAIERTVQSLIAAQDFLEAVRMLRDVEREWHAKSGDLLSTAEAERTQHLLSEAVKTARASFEREVKTSEAQPGAEVFKCWSLLEEEAGNFLEAGLQAEMARDYFAASLAFEKAGAFGQALAAFEQAAPHPDLLRKAELLRAGGDFFMAGLLYGRLRMADQAISMYEEASEFMRAAELLRGSIGDVEAAFDERFLSLMTKAHRTEELAELCYSKAHETGRSAEERARYLRRIKELADKSLIGEKWLERVASELPEVELSDRAQFDERAGRLAYTAADEVLAAYVDAFGLDLGTTNSVIALYNKRLEKPEVVEWLGRQMFPSVFIIDHDGREVVGEHEAEWLGKSPRAIITKAKRVIGSETKYKAGGQIYRPEEISARLIAHARLIARKHLLKKIGDRISALASQELGTAPPDDWVNDYLEAHSPEIPLDKAVITVPAYFNDSQKQATRTAGQLAGIDVLRLIHEPTAACIAQRSIGDNDESVLVVDLGAGTLDLSLVEIGEGVYEVKEIEGDSNLGSADLDDLLYTHFVERIDREMSLNVSGHKLAVRRLRQASEDMKRELSAQTAWTITLPGLVADQSVSLSLTRAELEQMASPWLDGVRAACRKIKGKSSRVLLIGGGALMPSVRSHVKQVFGLEPGSGIDPLTAVARGAAIQAAILLGAAPQKLVLDAVPFSLGIRSYVERGKPKFDILIPKHKSIPASKSDTFTTLEDNQTVVSIEVYQGENPDPKDNFKIGQFNLDGIPPAQAGVPAIEVTFEIDVNCILSVTARDKATQRERSIRIADSHLLTPAQISSLRERLQHTQIYQDQLALLAKLTSELEALLGEHPESKVNELQKRLAHRVKHYEANMSRFAPAPSDNETLMAIYRERDELENTSLLAVDRLSTLHHSFRAWSDRRGGLASEEDKAQGIDRLNAIVTEGNSLLKRAREGTAVLNEVIGTYRRWLSVIEGLAVNPEGDAEYLVRHFLRLSRYEEAQSHFNRLPLPLTLEQAQLGLEILARSRNREGYAEFLERQAEMFSIERPDLVHLNHAVRLYAHSVVWIQHKAEERLIFGSGFFIGPRFIATNRHVITNEKLGTVIPAESIRVVTKEGVLQVSAIHVPSSGPDDVAIFELTKEETTARPLRLAYSELVEVGERIITIGFPSPTLSGFEENLYCNTGLVNRIRQSELCTERVLEISIELQGGISGAPILNEMGEVIGLVTYSTQRQHTTEGGYLQIERSFYAIPVGVLRQLCDEIDGPI